MKAYCPHEHSAAAGQAGCHQLSLPAKGWLSLAHALFPSLTDSRLQTLTELEWKPTSPWQFCLEPAGMTRELNINGLLQLNDPFQGQAPNVCVFSEHRHSP